jgi:hypothetical protein
MTSIAGPELVIGLVGAVGCDLPTIAEAFVTALRDVNYDGVSIRLSHLLHDLQPYAHLPGIHDQEDSIAGHMDAGNDLRAKTTADVMARLAITRIRVARERVEKDESENEPRPLVA